MDRLCSLRGCTGHDSELNLLTLPVPSPEQGVGLERPEAVTRARQCVPCQGQGLKTTHWLLGAYIWVGSWPPSASGWCSDPLRTGQASVKSGSRAAGPKQAWELLLSGA